MVTEEALLSALVAVGVELQPWQVNLLRIYGLVDHDEDSTPDRSTPQWKRYAMRRLARQWHTEARVMLARSMDESLDQETWEYLAREAGVLRHCADRLLEEAK